MNKAIIFGCGNIGESAYWKLHNRYEIIAWTDNNNSLWGQKKEGIDIVSPDKMYRYVHDGVILFVAVVKSADIVTQLHNHGIYDFYVWTEGFFFYNEKRGFLSDGGYRNDLQVKPNSVLFVANTVVGGIREYRLALFLKSLGYTVYLAYFTPSKDGMNDGFVDAYERVFPIMSLAELIEISAEKNFEFIHSSSEPEWATAFLIGVNKTLIHECHDLGSANVNMTLNDLAMEYLSNVFADGVIYPTEALRDEAVRKFGINRRKTLVIENLISEELVPDRYCKKLSTMDGKIHAVYEGAITSSDVNDKRFFEKIWLKLAEEEIVIHFYTNHAQEYCKYLAGLHENIIYEGNLSSKELATEMTKYDVGLMLFNVNNRNKKYLESASPNKLYEYINAGIPVATSGVDAYRAFVLKYNVGTEIDFAADIYSQFIKLKEMKIPKDFLKERGLTIEGHGDEIKDFLANIMEKR